MILTLNEISKRFTDKYILDNITKTINEKDKIGVIGYNGCGKSTLLNIISGVLGEDKGEIICKKDIKISYLSQNDNYDDDKTILEYAIDNTANVNELELKKNLTKLGLANHDKKIKELSSGQKKIISLAICLSKECDLLLLDEPTNNLDSFSIAFLENHLQKYSKALLMVTHDRYFLERVTKKIWEIDNGKIYEYEANYSLYLELKNERIQNILLTEKKREAFLKKELEWVREGVRARETKSKKRLENFEKLSNEEKYNQQKQIETFNIATRLGKKIVEVKNATLHYDKEVFKDFSLILDKSSRIGIVGSNGSGKTSILKTIMGKSTLTKGSVEIGATVRFGYYSSSFEDMPFEKRVIDYINDIKREMESDGKSVSSTILLEKFLFDSEKQFTKIGSLSGGEKRRLYLLGVLITFPNVLLLDEVANDLDITTLSVLENYLNDFEGAVVVATHDRYFLDSVCSEILYINDGIIERYNGNYSFFIDNKKFDEKKDIKNEKKEQVKEIKVKTKLNFNEKKELQSLENEIGEIEEKIKEINEFINLNYSNYNLIKDKVLFKERLENELETKLERWDYLSSFDN